MHRAVLFFSCKNVQMGLLWEWPPTLSMCPHSKCANACMCPLFAHFWIRAAFSTCACPLQPHWFVESIKRYPCCETWACTVVWWGDESKQMLIQCSRASTDTGVLPRCYARHSLDTLAVRKGHRVLGLDHCSIHRPPIQVYWALWHTFHVFRVIYWVLQYSH